MKDIIAKMKIYDTTLRDGTQNKEIRFTVKDKLSILELLDKCKVDYAELGWPGSNPKDMEAFKEASKNKYQHIKIAAFCSTRRKDINAEEDPNLKAVIESKATVATVFGKTWLDQVAKQLRATPEENLKAIEDSIKFLKKHCNEVFYDAEHFFDGYKDNKEYALKCLSTASKAGANALVLCDTNGGCLPQEILKIVNNVKKEFPKEKIGIHCHNDSGCAVANSIVASELLDQIQGTINGFGERAGNADLCQIIPSLVLKQGIRINFNLKKLKEASDRVYMLANIKENHHQPFVGKNAFAHKGGIHVDAISKGAVYEHIDPELVGNKREIVLSDLSGTANIVEVLKEFDIEADKKDPRVKEMLDELKDLEKKGYDIQDLKAEKFLLAYKHFMAKDLLFKVDRENWKITTGRKKGSEFSQATMRAVIDNIQHEATLPVHEQGPVDSAYEALKSLISLKYKEIKDIKLSNFKVMIAEDKGAESSVRVYIEFKTNDDEFGTTGVSTNIIEASIEAIVKGFRYFLANKKMKNYEHKKE